jgi:DNA-binding transcriptional MocR family regulator
MVGLFLLIGMLQVPKLDGRSEVPLYRQLADFIRHEIERGWLVDGDRLPPTRDLSNQIGLNRTTVAAAYSLLEQDGLIQGHVGRGSFVNYRPQQQRRGAGSASISFASSRPAESEFPLPEFSATVREVLASPDAASILQLGAPSGYAPLRRYLFEQSLREGVARADDDILIVNGCQQALDLVQRVFAGSGERVLIEDPVYHGLKNVFLRGGSPAAVPVGRAGMDVGALADEVARGADLIVVTPNFQNPTGTTLPLEARKNIVELAARTGALVLENDIYGELRYRGAALPTVKQLDPNGRTLLVRSFSKIAFPGLRVGWVVGPRRLIAQLAEAKQWSDLHTDQLSQAVLLRFAESGRLGEHVRRVRAEGARRLEAVLDACERHMPSGSEWTQPDGGMSLWVTLPEPLNAAELLAEAERAGVTYLPGRQFAVAERDVRTLRLAFGGLTPDRIEEGTARLGRVFRGSLGESGAVEDFAATQAVV